ncbi:GNAT family N-acetyltransferase [Streptococcus ovuberis]|uniref:N-acetyltransferase n=1 Tax=Streptococcus ovuberis TaxID=1936207 RepID=A0A7X6MZH7_9STRE|nr:GNAT family N-acetyltransferase [Streptococcus ovuberis]NKZ19447.1 N-acetyltransferase [Streptococcus ovuberis]
MTIRPASPTDTKALLDIYAHYIKKTAITFEYEVPTVENFSERIRNIQERFPYLVFEENGHVLGYAYASPYKERAAYDWTVELSIYIHPKARQKGIGQALYQTLEEALHQQNIVNLLACISLPNEASIHFHEKQGFREVAHFKEVGFKFNRWHDIIWMQKRINK